MVALARSTTNFKRNLHEMRWMQLALRSRVRCGPRAKCDSPCHRGLRKCTLPFHLRTYARLKFATGYHFAPYSLIDARRRLSNEGNFRTQGVQWHHRCDRGRHPGRASGDVEYVRPAAADCDG